MCHVLISCGGGAGGAIPVRCYHPESGARFAVRLGSPDGKSVHFGARRGSAPASVWIPGIDPPMENPTMPRFRRQTLQHMRRCRAPLGTAL